MARIHAVILTLGLVLAPIVSLSGAQSGVAKQCSAFCPMRGHMHELTQERMHGAAQATAGQTNAMQCHHQESSRDDCVMKSGCGDTLVGVAAPLPPATITPIEKFAPAREAEILSLSEQIQSSKGFKTPPLKPPRA